MWAAQKRENGRTNLSLLFPFSENVLLPSDTPFDWGAPLGTVTRDFFLSFFFPSAPFSLGRKDEFPITNGENYGSSAVETRSLLFFAFFSSLLTFVPWWNTGRGTWDVEHGTIIVVLLWDLPGQWSECSWVQMMLSLLSSRFSCERNEWNCSQSSNDAVPQEARVLKYRFMASC